MPKRRNQGWAHRLSDFSIISLLINPVTLMIGVSVIAIVLWNKYHDRLDVQVNRPIDRELLHVNEMPDWIKTDIRKVAIQESRLDEISLSEPRAVEMVAASFAVQPWVKGVNQIRKTSSGIHVDLQYRRPMAVVEIGKESLIPVDDEGVVLDSRDFAHPDADLNYWRIWVPRPMINGLLAGHRWDDMRVTDSILIANAWDDRFRQAGLAHIVNRSEPTRDRLRLRFYELWTLRNTIVIWGNPPGYEVEGEASAKQKIAAIQAFVKEHGSLDNQRNRLFDVRGGKLVRSDLKLASEDADFVKRKF